MRGITILAMIGLLGLSIFAVAQEPKVEFHGLFYTYGFFWDNADFDDATADGDQHYYVHGDVSADCDFGYGISTHAVLGDWGTFGRHAITYEGPEGVNGHLLEAYLTGSGLFDTPVSFRIGKEHLLYGDGVFDGGEDGFMGAKLFLNTDMLDVDLFGYRLQEGGGTNFIGTLPSTTIDTVFYVENDTVKFRVDTIVTATVSDDWDLYGVWATGKLLNGAFKLSPYGFYRTLEKDNPIWAGLRGEGSLMGLDLAVEFTTMLGKNDTIDYKGMHYLGRLSYTPPAMPITLGGAYLAFSGDDPATKENELYESPTWGPYTFGFYKAWPGFGPAHLLRTGYGFSLLAPWEPMVTNLNVINGNLGVSVGPLSLRLDLFNYTRNLKEEDNPETEMGNEIAALIKYNYRETLTIGGTLGYWIPGKYFGEDLEPMMGGYLFVCMGF